MKYSIASSQRLQKDSVVTELSLLWALLVASSRLLSQQDFGEFQEFQPINCGFLNHKSSLLESTRGRDWGAARYLSELSDRPGSLTRLSGARPDFVYKCEVVGWLTGADHSVRKGPWHAFWTFFYEFPKIHFLLIRKMTFYQPPPPWDGGGVSQKFLDLRLKYLKI